MAPHFFTKKYSVKQFDRSAQTDTRVMSTGISNCRATPLPSGLLINNINNETMSLNLQCCIFIDRGSPQK